MTFDLPIIVIVISIVFFYLKLIYMNWRKARKAAKTTNIAVAKAKKQGKAPKIPDKPAMIDRFYTQVSSWYIVGGALLLVIVGLVFKTVDIGLPAGVIASWWVLISVGIVGLSFGIK